MYRIPYSHMVRIQFRFFQTVQNRCTFQPNKLLCKTLYFFRGHTRDVEINLIQSKS